METKLTWFESLNTELDIVAGQCYYVINYAGIVLDEIVIEENEIWRYE